MADQLSPGVVIRELDLTNTVPVVGIAGGATVADFLWGPVDELTRVSSSKDIENIFGKPNDKNYVGWFTASNFLSYTGDLTLVRVIDSAAKNSTDDGNGIVIRNPSHFQTVQSSPTGVKFASKYPGAMGDSIAISMADKYSFSTWAYKDLFDAAPGTSVNAEELGAADDELHVVVIDKNGQFSGIVGGVLESFPYLSKAANGKDINYAPAFYASVLNAKSRYVWVLEGENGTTSTTSVGGAIATATVTGNGGSGYTTATVTVSGGGTGAVIDAVITAGKVTGLTIVNAGTGYTSPTITITGDGTGATGTATATPITTSSTVDFGENLVSNLGVPAVFNRIPVAITHGLTGGADSVAVDAQELCAGYKMFANAEEVDVGLIFTGDGGGETSHRVVNQYVLDNVALQRRDVVAFMSPKLSDVLGKTQSAASTSIVATRDAIGRSTSFGVMDSGWKLQYDVYNDKYRYVPLNGDIAGLCAQTSNTNDDWWSPAGYTRGNIKNVVSLVYNPDKQSRDVLYKVGINPVVTFKTDGTILYGDKTLQGKNSAFSYIGIRRLFIRLQKAISNAAKYSLFEFNDQYTRANFRNMVNPYMRDVQGRRGLDDFRVVCDETNNTPEVIMRGEFVGAIYVKPAYSIQWVRLDFVAVRRDVKFEEVVGQI